MNANYLSMMAQRLPMGQAQQSKMMQMLMAKRQQMQQPQASIMPVGQPMQQMPQTIAQPPMRPGNRLMPRGMQNY
jgi:hypothetical protein